MKLIERIARELFRPENLRDLSEFNSELPSGSGFDSGCEIIEEESNSRKIVIRADFHHMNDAGFYDGWTSHRVIVTPCFVFGFDLKITGRDRNGIKEYIGDVFAHCLNMEKESE